MSTNIKEEVKQMMVEGLSKDLGVKICSYGFTNFARLLTKIEKVAADPWDIFLQSQLAETFDTRFEAAGYSLEEIVSTDQDVEDVKSLIESLVTVIISSDEIMQGLSDLLSSDGVYADTNMVDDYLIFMEGSIGRWITALQKNDQFRASFEETSMRVKTSHLFLGMFHA